LFKAICILVLVLASGFADAQGVSSLADLRRVTDEVMKKVGDGNVEAGLLAFKHLTIIPQSEFETLVGQTKLQLPMVVGRFGASIGQEFLSEDKIGDSLARITYINKFEKHAMRWVFYCYKGKNGWVINTFRFDDKWPELFGN
jgi:hypothetical protein